jgi:hypothetical protein
MEVFHFGAPAPGLCYAKQSLMASVQLDDNNVHHFWGLSPPVDLLALCQPVPAAGGSVQETQPLRILQVWEEAKPQHAAWTSMMCRALFAGMQL